MPDDKNPSLAYAHNENQANKNGLLFFFFPDDFGSTPLEPPEILPILNPSNFVPKNGFPVVKGLRRPRRSEKKSSQKKVYLYRGMSRLTDTINERHTRRHRYRKKLFCEKKKRHSNDFWGV